MAKKFNDWSLGEYSLWFLGSNVFEGDYEKNAIENNFYSEIRLLQIKKYDIKSFIDNVGE